VRRSNAFAMTLTMKPRKSSNQNTRKLQVTKPQTTKRRLERITRVVEKTPVITSIGDSPPQTKKGLIIQTIASADRPLFPREISKKTGLNRSTVRVYLRELLREGVLRQPFYGVYCNNPTYGVGALEAPRVHNLRLRMSGVSVPRGFPKRVEVFGDVKVQVIFGSKRGIVTGILSSDRGMNFTSCVLAIERFRAVVKEELGLECSTKDMNVTVCELNDDLQGLRLDGLSSLTARSFLGSLERIYNRREGLRSEVQVRPDSIESIYVLLKGGVTSYNVVQMLFMLGKKLDDLIMAQKFQNENLQRIYRIFKNLVSNHFSWFFEIVARAIGLAINVE